MGYYSGIEFRQLEVNGSDVYESAVTRATFKFKVLRGEDEAYRAFLSKQLYPYLASRSTSKGVRVMWWNRDLADDELQESVIHDSIFASLSVAFILVFMTIHTRSLWLAVWALLGIIYSFPLAYVCYVSIFGYEKMMVLNFLSLYVIMGIGADDVFIFTDLWVQSRARVDDPVKERARRLKLTYRRAGAAMFITSATTAASFFSNVVSPILPLREFGVFMGLTVVGNFFTVMTLYPSALIVWDIGTCAVCKRKKKNERKRSASMELSAPSLIESLDVRDTEVENEEQRAESPVEGAASHIHTTAQFWMKKNAFNLGNDSGFRKIERFFHNVYAPALSAIKWKVIVVLTIVAAAAIYGAVSKFEASDQIPDFFDDSKNLGLIHQTRRKYFGYGAVGTATRPEMSGGFIVPDDHLQPTKKPTTAMPTISPTTRRRRVCLRLRPQRIPSPCFQRASLRCRRLFQLEERDGRPASLRQNQPQCTRRKLMTLKRPRCRQQPPLLRVLLIAQRLVLQRCSLPLGSQHHTQLIFQRHILQREPQHGIRLRHLQPASLRSSQLLSLRPRQQNLQSRHALSLVATM